MDSFHTERLRAEPLTEMHIAELVAMHQDSDVMATLGGPRSSAQTLSFVRTNLLHWENHSFGVWIVRMKDDGAFAGRGGLRHVVLEGSDVIEVNYALCRPCWGRGLATELALQLVAIATGPLGLTELVAFTLNHNTASVRVMQKAGFVFDRNFDRNGKPHVLYRFRRAS